VEWGKKTSNGMLKRFEDSPGGVRLKGERGVCGVGGETGPILRRGDGTQIVGRVRVIKG